MIPPVICNIGDKVNRKYKKPVAHDPQIKWESNCTTGLYSLHCSMQIESQRICSLCMIYFSCFQSLRSLHDSEKVFSKRCSCHNIGLITLKRFSVKMSTLLTYYSDILYY